MQGHRVGVGVEADALKISMADTDKWRGYNCKGSSAPSGRIYLSQQLLGASLAFLWLFWS